MLPNTFPYLFGSAFLAFGKLHRIPAGCLAPHLGLFQLVVFTVHINDVLQLFPHFIQKLEILWIANISRTAGCIQDEGALVLTGAAVLIVVIVLIFLRGGSCQQSKNGKRFRNSTVVDAPKGHLLVYSFRQRQYCKYGFSLTCRTVHSSLHWSSCLMISAPNAIRAGCAGLPLFTNCLA